MTDIHSLFRMPLDPLMLSQTTIKALKWDGITSIGDCLASYTHDAHDSISATSRLHHLMYGEVFPALVEQGYWRVMQECDIWQRLVQIPLPYGYERIIEWQGRDCNLYEIFIDTLKLSDRVFASLWRLGIKSIGDCTRMYERPTRWYSSVVRAPISAIEEAVYMELEQALKTQGYWSFMEEQYDVGRPILIESTQR